MRFVFFERAGTCMGLPLNRIQAVAISALLVVGSVSVSQARGIAAIVNDEPISKFDVEQRINLKLMSGSKQLQQRLRARLKSKNINKEFRAFAIKRNPRSREEVKALQKQFVAGIRRSIMRGARPGMRKAALEELIDEKLKIQEAKRNNIVIGDADVDKIVTTIAQRNKRTVQQFAQTLGRANVRLATFKKRMRANMAWQRFIRRKFGRQISIANQDIDRMVGDGGDGETATTELRLQRIKVTVPGKLNQAKMAARYSEADSLRRGFKGCDSTRQVAARLDNASVENMGWKNANSFQEPTRSVLLNGVGKLTPAMLTSFGFELYAVCGKRAGKGGGKKRAKVKEDLRQEEFQLLAKRHLRDLRRDAFIEYR